MLFVYCRNLFRQKTQYVARRARRFSRRTFECQTQTTYLSLAQCSRYSIRPVVGLLLSRFLPRVRFTPVFIEVKVQSFPSNIAHRVALIFVFFSFQPAARHQLTLPDHGYGASISVVQQLGRQICDREVASPTPGRCIAGQLSSTQNSIPRIPPRYVNQVSTCGMGLGRGAFTCVGQQVTLSDPIWQVSSVMGVH